jgi:hypothetical protein
MVCLSQVCVGEFFCGYAEFVLNFFVLFAYFVLVVLVYTSCMLRGALHFFNDIFLLTYPKKKKKIVLTEFCSLLPLMSNS